MSRKTEPSLLDDAHEIFKLTPFWLGPLVAAASFLLIRFIIPLFIPKPAPGTFDPHALIHSLP